MNLDLPAPAMDDAHRLHEGIIVAQDRHALLFARNRELHRQFGWSPEACSETAWGKDAALHATASRILEQLHLLDCLIERWEIYKSGSWLFIGPFVFLIYQAEHTSMWRWRLS